MAGTPGQSHGNLKGRWDNVQREGATVRSESQSSSNFPALLLFEVDALALALALGNEMERRLELC